MGSPSLLIQGLPSGLSALEPLEQRVQEPGKVAPCGLDWRAPWQADTLAALQTNIL